MTIEEKALNFAIKAHKGQVRKSEPDKPMIFHPINVGQILKEYGFDENVVSAGFLHDVVEDTKYTFDDIKREFGDDIASLVYSASEPDKSLSWEERKKHTINSIKDLDTRHRAVICADKISNLEDLFHLFGKTGKIDFSIFKRGFQDQQWYYTKIFESLKDDENLKNMLDIYKNYLEEVFYAGDINIFLRNMIFNDDKDRYDELKRLHHKKQELYKLKSLSEDIGPYVIEIVGTPNTGKTGIVNNLNDFFNKGGFITYTINKYNKNGLYIPYNMFDTKFKDKDIVLADEFLLDSLVSVDRIYNNKELSNSEFNSCKEDYISLIKKYFNIIIGTYTDSLTSIKRDYKSHISLEDRHILDKKNIDEYNESFNNIEKLCKENEINFHRIDTTLKSEDEVSIEATNIILDDARNEYIKRLKKEFRGR